MLARIVVRIFVLLAVVFFGLLTAPRHSPVRAGAAVPPQAPPPPPCGERSPVALNPSAGPDGTSVTASGCGWAPGSQITVAWDNPQTTLATTTADAGGGFVVSFAVPATAPPGNHQVLFTQTIQSCPGCVQRSETALFAVTAEPPPPTPTPTPTSTPTPGPPPPACNPSMPVTLTPTFGPDGTLVTANGCGFTPGSQVMVSWDNEEPLAFTTVNPDGTFTVSFVVPEDADEGPHQVFFTQSCVGFCAPQVATGTFEVTQV